MVTDKSPKACWVAELQTHNLDFEIVVLQQLAAMSELERAEMYWINIGRVAGTLTNARGLVKNVSIKYGRTKRLVSFTKDMLEWLKGEASSRQISVSELMRRIVDNAVAVDEG
jgi:hypothetical protein